jgi:predicted RNA-binding Zn ribbon-like protein
MSTPQQTFDPVTPYRFVGGDLAIDFVNTADWTARGLELDRFTSYPRLLEWVEGSGALEPEELEGLRGAAARDEYAAQKVVHDARELRELLERTFSRLVRGKRIDEELSELNRGWLRRSLAELAVVRRDREGHAGDGKPLALGWPRAAHALESPLWSVAWSAARLLASDDAKRIRRCAGIDCGWYYVDRSRNGLRRWCEMETCGTLMKTRRRAERNARGRGASDRSEQRHS